MKKRNQIKLTRPEKVKAFCAVSTEGKTSRFTQFITVGFTDDGELLVTAADLRDLAKGIQMLKDVYDEAIRRVSPDVRRDVEADVIIEASLEKDYDNV